MPQTPPLRATIGDEPGGAVGMLEAADILGMTRMHLVRLSDDGRVERIAGAEGNLIAADELHRVLIERERVEARGTGLESADQRRRARAARRAGLA